MTDRTQAAAQRCADLANAERGDAAFTASDFAGDAIGYDGAAYTAFRRYVETTDAMHREVLALLEKIQSVASPQAYEALRSAIDILRANLLPDPEPQTLLEEFWQAHPQCAFSGDGVGGIEFALDWIAKRQENEG